MTKPPFFESKLPDFLLEDAKTSKKDIWLMESVLKLTQTTDWLKEETCRQSDTLERVEVLAKNTNGRVTKAEGNIKNINEDIENLKRSDNQNVKDLKFWNFIKDWLKNKYVLILLGIVLFSFIYYFDGMIAASGGLIKFLTAFIKWFVS